MRKAPAIAALALLIALAPVTDASANHGYPGHFISKKRAQRLIRQAVYVDARENGYRVTELRLRNCRYGLSTWDRQRWLCDLEVEIRYRRRSTLCGWGRVVRQRGTSFSASRWNC